MTPAMLAALNALGVVAPKVPVDRKPRPRMLPGQEPDW